MKNEGRIIELLTEMVEKQRITIQWLDKLDSKLQRLSQIQITTPVPTNKMEELLELDKRVRKLENAVFK